MVLKALPWAILRKPDPNKNSISLFLILHRKTIWCLYVSVKIHCFFSVCLCSCEVQEVSLLNAHASWNYRKYLLINIEDSKKGFRAKIMTSDWQHRMIALKRVGDHWASLILWMKKLKASRFKWISQLHSGS